MRGTPWLGGDYRAQALTMKGFPELCHHHFWDPDAAHDALHERLAATSMAPILKQHAVGAWVRQLRTENRMSLRALASRTDFSASFISQVENGVVSPSIASMERIASALGVSLGEFFAAAAKGEEGLIVRAKDRLEMPSLWSQGRIEALSPMSGRRLEPTLITLEKGGRSGKHPHAHASEEFAFVVEGQPTLTLGPEEHELAAGDAVTIRPHELRRWENRKSPVVRILIVSLR
jgi:transcriptional regulator with XRE-family HTH domain